MNINQEDQWNLYCEIFSERRMSKYLAASHGAFQLAIEAHAANLDATANFWPTLSLLEIALRNTLNFQLELRNRREQKKTHWTLDPQNEIRKKNARSAQDLDQAREKLKRKRRPLTPGRILDELPLGFWTILVSKRFNDLWPDLALGFRGLESRDSKELRELLQFFKDFRNRISHHHIIIFMDLQVANEKLKRLAYLIDPRLAILVKDRYQINGDKPLSQTVQE